MSLISGIGKSIHEAVAHGHFRDVAKDAAKDALVLAKPVLAAKIARVANRHGIQVPEMVVEEIVDSIIAHDEDDTEQATTDE